MAHNSAARLAPRLWSGLRSSSIRPARPYTNEANTSRERLQSYRPYVCGRCLHTSRSLRLPPSAPKTTDRGPTSKEDTQTDFNVMDVLGNTPPPATAIDACLEDGFVFGSGVRLTGAGTMLVGGEVFRWRPWDTSPAGLSGLINPKGLLHFDPSSFGVLSVLWPKPDLLVIGTGSRLQMLSPENRKLLNELGIRLEVLDTRNAAAQYNLLATERGIQSIAAALIPLGWDGRKGRI